MDEQELRTNMLLAVATGKIEPDALPAMFALLGGAPILKQIPTPEQKAAGLDTICHTKDANGNVLVAGQNYTLRGQKVKVLRERFGAGNAIDTYYRVFYLGSDLEESFECVDAKYPEGIFEGPVYKSRFEPIKQ